MDYAAAAGTSVYAPWSGFVTTGYESGGAGNWVWVDDGPYRFKSFHHSAFQVFGGFVNAGDVIAYIGTTGSSTGPHAHLELWDHGQLIDPTAYFDRAPLKGTSPAPTPEPEDDDVAAVIAWGDTAAYELDGLFKRNLSPAEVDLKRFLGLEDIGYQPAIVDATTESPRIKLAGT